MHNKDVTVDWSLTLLLIFSSMVERSWGVLITVTYFPCNLSVPLGDYVPQFPHLLKRGGICDFCISLLS